LRFRPRSLFCTVSDSADKTLEEAAPPKEENIFLNLVLNIVLPSIILGKLSKEEYLGPLLALIVAISLPIGYGIYDFAKRRNFNFFSLLGFISVLLTGGLGLMKASPQQFAIKEAVIPLLFASAILLSHLKKKPFIESMLLNPQLLNLKKLNAALDVRNSHGAFHKLMFQCSLFLAATLCGSSIANYFLAMKILRGTEGGSEEYMAGIGKITWMGYLMIGIPMMIAMGGIFYFLLKGLKRVTGLDTDELTTEDNTKTVKKKVSKGKVLSEKDMSLEELAKDSEEKS